MQRSRLKDKVVVITGASAGIGRACAQSFASEGARLALGARRAEALQEFAHTVEEQCGVQVYSSKLDVCDSAQVEEFVAQTLQTFGRIDILINNAGLALGVDKLSEGDERDWARMIDTNVMGALRITRVVIRHMLSQPDGGHVINIGSIAGHIAYEGGGVYCATKHALRAITEALRLEVLGKPIRVGSIDPGMVETEFSGVRFRGDLSRAKSVYQAMTPLAAEDIAECAVFMASRPAHVCIDRILINPTDQAGLKVSRRE